MPTEQTLTRLLKGSIVEWISVYPNSVQVHFRSGTFLSVSGTLDGVEPDIVGPEPPEKEMLRETWAEESGT
jgi:hypothetical protein